MDLNKTWAEAQQYCRANFIDLATVENHDHLVEMISVTGNNPPPVWIGYQGKWEWSLHETDFIKWKGGENPYFKGTPSCAFILTNGDWGDYYCDGHNMVLCYSNGETHLCTMQV